MEIRLQKLIAQAGVASRREAERLIEAGRVAVNGRVVREQGIKVDPTVDEVRVDTVVIPKPPTRPTYLLLNKPRGVLCTVRDPQGRPTVLDLVPPFHGKRLYPVGRLDEDSAGLVLLTNDGEITERLTHPRFRVPKIYDVRVKGRVTPEDAQKFEAGVWLSEGRTGRSRVQIRRSGPKVTHVAITLSEGKNREIRRAFAKLGFAVLSLRRIQIGPIVARGLKPGQFRPLDAEEVAALQALAEGSGDVRPLRKGSSGRPRGRPGKPDPASHGGARGGAGRRGGSGGSGPRGGQRGGSGGRGGPASRAARAPRHGGRRGR